jgi:ADP-ribosylglycohydrolase
MSALTESDRWRGAIWGSLVGDALGVPVEFKGRATVQADPVRDMRGFGTHYQPPGTWSDDSSLLLCTAESLVEKHTLDLIDLGERFVRWETDGYWTPHGKVFDIGIATSQALSRIAMGAPPEEAGGEDEYSNGNGSLMRILPIVLWFQNADTASLLEAVHRASAVTHRHPRSQAACGYFALFTTALLRGLTPHEAAAKAYSAFHDSYSRIRFAKELPHFKNLHPDHLLSAREPQIRSSGYVMHTLEASLWCLLATSSFDEAVLKAVNLGEDTDTTGCVTGALAGAAYGVSSIRPAWIESLARHHDIASLVERFVASAAL